MNEESATPETKSVRVLVVDDDDSIRLLVKRALERSGFLTETAQDGQEALEKLEEQRFDLLVLDVMMPRVDGMEVVDRLTKTGEPRPKILIMTAASPSVIRDLPRDRVEKILTKPFDIEALVRSAVEAAGRDDPPAPGTTTRPPT